jgi:hypothetical protein
MVYIHFKVNETIFLDFLDRGTVCQHKNIINEHAYSNKYLKCNTKGELTIHSRYKHYLICSKLYLGVVFILLFCPR